MQCYDGRLSRRLFAATSSHDDCCHGLGSGGGSDGG
jgi:hypothetical protein